MERMISTLKAFANEEDGATAIEYGLLAALIGAVIIGTVTLLGQKLDVVFGTVKDAF
jgi:pilus assembly protein Flp/PilA